MTNSETESHPKPDKEQSAEAEKRDRSRKKIVAACFFLFFIVLWLVIHYFASALTSTVSAETGENRFRIVEIPSGGSVSDIARKLAEEGIISNQAVFKIAATIRRSTRDLKAGEYVFDTSMSPFEVLGQLEEGRIMLHEFTIPEGYTAKQISRRLHKMGLTDGEEFLSLVEDVGFCKELGIDGSTLEGYLFPDTYRMARGLPTKTVLHMMVDRFWTVCSKEVKDNFSLDDPGLRDIVTIASVIEKEAIYDMEKPLIASVIYNRLERKMPLQCDVTIRYPLDNYGVHLTYADLAIDSPYNSYLYPGLPPTPICSPGLSAIKAALSPSQTDYLYFVSMNNGHHKFSSSLTEHNEAVHKYQILNERG
jgi:UPF0755 protein